ncbi:MAG: site-2 protease family protein [Actinomycetota bacterium]
MNETLHLGSIRGIRIGVNWTVLVIFTLILIGLSTVQFPTLFDDLSPTAAWTAGTLAAITFFASLLAHELAHALMAQRYGVRVEGITLWLFGGMARLLDDAPSPTADLLIAAVGPLTSLALSAAFGLLSFAAGLLGIGGITLGVLGWLALINLVLAAFNLIPAAPLDGGRVLRSLLWMYRGDRTRAAITAARAGRAFGFALIGLGLALVVFLPGLGGLWLALIGWFISNSAAAEEQHAQVQGRLGGLTVGELMTPNPVVVGPEVSVASLLEDYVLRNRFSAFPVVDEDGRPLGLITLSRIKQLDAEQRAATLVGDIACGRDEIPIAAPSEPVVSLLQRMDGCSDGRALVVEEERVVGIVSPTDIARTLQLAELFGPSGPRPARP